MHASFQNAWLKAERVIDPFFILEDTLSIWMNLGNCSLLVSSVKTGTRHIIGQIMALVPVFPLEPFNSILPNAVQS